MKMVKHSGFKICRTLIFAAVAGLSWATAHAQSVKNVLPAPAAQSPADAVQLARSEGIISKPAAKPPITQITREPVTGGIIAQAARLKNPLQLLNPFAPSSCGGGEANLVSEVITKKPVGLAFLIVRF